MTGIEAITVYIPERRISNLALQETFDIDEKFLTKKIGVVNRAIKSENEDTSDMAIKALESLLIQTGLNRDAIELLIVVTQNPDMNIPQVSGLVHGKAGLSQNCAAFDVSLGCSGYVYGLSVLQSFITANGMKRGVLITCDPYSKIIDPSDKNTVLLFGDAATATLVGPEPIFEYGPFLFGTQGDLTGALTCKNGTLHMNGRDVFNFAATTVPKHIEKLLAKSGITKDDVDCYLLHQGSRYIVETLARRLEVEPAKVLIDIEDVGNTVSSSIPILLQKIVNDQSLRQIVLCGFGVGLSWASCICKRKEF